MTKEFELEFKVRWNELDANGHLASTSYIHYAYHTRMSFFESLGFNGTDFQKNHLGPVLFKEETQYFKEMKMQESVYVNILLDGISEDNVKFRLVNEMKNHEGQLVAIVTAHAAWFDQKERKLCKPPQKLAAAMRNMPQTKSFAPIVKKNNL